MRVLDGVEIDDLVADLAAVVVVEVRRVGLEPNDGTVLRGKFNPWDANPWCAFTTVEKISKEDV